MLFNWVDALKWKRAIWVREIQPGLVAADPSVSLVRISVYLVAAAMFNWSCSWWWLAALESILAMLLSVIRYYYSRYRPNSYVRWRWLLILGLSLDMALGAGNTLQCIVAPPSSISSFLKTLLMASGVVVSAQALVLDREMFYLSCPCSGLLVALLCWNSEVLCSRGLLASDYGRSMTRRVFYFTGMVANFIANCVGPYESGPLLSVPGPPAPSEDLPSCLCLARTLLLTFGFLLPNTLLYLYEHQAIQWWAKRGRGNTQLLHHDRCGYHVLPPSYFKITIRATVITALGGTLTWAALRSYHKV